MCTHHLKFSCRHSNCHPMALFEFFTAPAWTGIISAHFATFPFCLAARSVVAILSLLGRHHCFLSPPFPLELLGLFLLLHRLEQVEESKRVLFDTVHQIFE